MPEGHVTHRLAAALRGGFAGDAVEVSSPQGRFAEAAKLLDGSTCVGADAYGKHLFVDFGEDRLVHIHLGIYGRLTIDDPPPLAPVGQVRMRLVGPRAWADLRGAAKCDLIDSGEQADVIARLGPDPLQPRASGARAWQRIHSSRAPIAGLLMDQGVVAGVGNIFRAEVLFRHAVDPMLPGRDLPEPVWKAMWKDLRALMRAGVRVGRIDTVRAEHDPAVTGRAPRRDRHGGEVYVYRRAGQPCHVCGTPVATKVLAARNLFWCPTCQPAGSAGSSQSTQEVARSRR
ncbi:MAG TPA: zinc finger domain-containing protein [Acidothermaceae bacterium]